MADGNGHYRLRLVGTMTAIIVGAVAVGFIPRCDDVQTRAMAKEQHEQLQRECTASSDRLMRSIEHLTELVVEALAPTRKEFDDANRRRH